MNLLTIFYTFMTALFASLVLVPFLRRWALDRGDLDQPDARKVHSVPTPRLGGVAIFLSFLFTSIVFIPIDSCSRGLLAGGLIIFATGLADDLVGISAKQKFVGEVAACATALLIGRHYLINLGDLFGFGEIILSPWLGIPFTVFAVVGVINAVNLIDGLDGLAGGVSVIALSAFLIFGLLMQDPIAVLLSAGLLGAILGFLKYNFYPARIFMGDTGSLTVGFLLGFLAVHITQHPQASVSPVLPLLVLGLPIADTVRVMGQRLLRGESPFAPDRSHVHHNFMNLGFEHRFTVLILYGITTFWVVVAVIGMHWPDYLLFYAYLGVNVVGYLLLSLASRRPEFLQRYVADANEGIRNSSLYRRISDLADLTVPAIQILLAIYALITVYELLHHNVVPWQIVILLLITGVSLQLLSEDGGRSPFLLLVVYAATGIAAFEVWSGHHTSIGATNVREVGDVLIGMVALLAGIKFTFRKPGEYFLSTPDFLVLVLCVTMAVASHTSSLIFDVNAPLFRFVLLLFGVRTVLTRQGNTHFVVSNAVLGFLLLVVGIGFIP